ncbi:cyclin-like protein [Lasiosphaeris hirsuta]|uniref:RNA polymerase II holoenzyme cyclin-like subunit n=1 Tax=Lasiosphaeris hirsuta TaxID=260670 RepID=A0AA40BBE6_9PEZI|nr:cyclin-like protein [Lasiosphaeris hirsuta]
MSNVDRYRPPREGYQPPSLPPKPPPTVLDRMSKSPSRRRDVPPAAPSPPVHSSRTSPPRPLSRRSAPSPAQSSPQRTPQAPRDQWYFTSYEVASTPSILDGLTLSEERLRRAKGVNFIYQAGILINLPQVTLWVAGVFFHRFYMRYSMAEDKGGIHHYNIAATALFLANKTEENCRKTKDLIIAVAKVAQKNAKLIIDEQSKEYWRWRDSIMAYEEVMLETLTFDLMVDNPYNQLAELLELLDSIHHKPVRDAAWAFCNDACLTVLPLLMTARDVAISAIFFATAVTHEKMDDVGGEPWWRYLKGSESLTVNAVSIVTEFYKENPLRKQDAKLPPGSPEFNLESTRRRGENIISHTEAGSSHNGSPIGTDRDTQSPSRGSRPNGRGANQAVHHDTGEKKEEGESEVKKEPVDFNSSYMSVDIASQASRGDSDAALKVAANDLAVHERGQTNGGGLKSPMLPNFQGGLKSPTIPGSMKRKSIETDLDRDQDQGEAQDRESKKPRLADDDEGEVKE